LCSGSALGLFAEGDQVERWLGGPMEHKKLSGREEATFFHASIGGHCPLEGNGGLVYVAYSGVG